METVSRAGRPRQFNEDKVLDDAVKAFWAWGSSATTRQLESCLGVKQSSIYNTFGSKGKLFHRTIDRYLANVDRELLTPLDEPETGIDQLLTFLDQLHQWISNPDHPGCLMLNVLVEQAANDDQLVAKASNYRSRLRETFTKALEPTSGPRATLHANALLAGVLGLNMAATGRAPEEELAAMTESIKAQVKSWQASPLTPVGNLMG